MSLFRRRLLRLAPLCAFALSGSAAWVLVEHVLGAADPGPQPGAPNPLVGDAVPPFTLPPLDQSPAPTSEALVALHAPVLLNFFASWCGPCQGEIPILLDLQRQGLAIWGIAYHDRPDSAAAFLAQFGNPYQRIGRDDGGRLEPTFQLTGLPESFLVDRAGIVRWNWAGALTRNVVGHELAPRWQAAA